MPFPRQNIELVGNLGKEPEQRFTPSGAAVTQFSLAVSRQWKQDGEDKKETIWVSVTCWQKLAELAAKLPKGAQVLVKGYFKPDPATGGPRVWARASDGSSGASYELTASEVWLSLFSKGAGVGGHSEPDEFSNAPGAYDDDNIPF